MRFPVLLLAFYALLVYVCSFEDSFSNFECQNDGICISKPESRQPRSTILPEAKQEIKTPCEDRHNECATFSSLGHCTHHPGWMIVNCPLACDSCHLRDHHVRCQRSFLNISTEPSYQPGDLDIFFRSLGTSSKEPGWNVTYLSRDPYVVQIDNFISGKEADQLLGAVEGWNEMTPGDNNIDESKARDPNHLHTGTTHWCMGNCIRDETVKAVSQRIAVLTNLPVNNFEAFQFTKNNHQDTLKPLHDFGMYQLAFPSGPRVLTSFIHLTDVAEGGETHFSMLDITVKPKKGRAIIWPNTLIYDLSRIDARLIHEGLPVIEGTKYGVNSWAHLYDYVVPNHWGCTGSFEAL